MKKIGIGIKIDPGLLALIDNQAKSHKRSRSDMIRIMADFWLEEKSPKKEKTA